MSFSVVKVGGSLFDWPDFKTRLRCWLHSIPQSRIVILPGGGKYADKVRRWQAQQGWTDARSHDRALDMLMITSRLMKRWLPDACWTNDPRRISASTSRIVILDCSGWARQLENLPQTWKLTSDSLAAMLATQLEAAELVLLKSRLPVSSEMGQDPDLVDPLFAHYATTSVRVVNLRSPNFSECEFSKRGDETTSSFKRVGIAPR